MSRRRYISTDISLDTKVNKLAVECGDFAALLYTWLIPHAGDDGVVTGDAEEILFKVAPGRRDKSPEDIDAALCSMDELGLVTWDRENRAVRLRPSSFYKYQTYIQQKNRRETEEPVPYNNNGGNQRETPEVIAEQRETAQKGASFSPSPSPSLSVSPSVSPSPSPSRNGAAAGDDLASQVAEDLGLRDVIPKDLKSIRSIINDQNNVGLNAVSVAEDYIRWLERQSAKRQDVDRIAGFRNQMKMRRGNEAYMLVASSNGGTPSADEPASPEDILEYIKAHSPSPERWQS